MAYPGLQGNAALRDKQIGNTRIVLLAHPAEQALTLLKSVEKVRLFYGLICILISRFKLMKHHTKEKGDLGVLAGQFDLAKQGFLILWPITEHAPFDLVIYKELRFYRVQVKYVNINKRKQMVVHFRSNWTDKHGTHTVKVDKSQIDLYCIYCPSTNECYYVNPHEYKESITIRLNPPSRLNGNGYHLAKDFRVVPVSQGGSR